MILNQNGYESISVYGGRQAVEKARRWSPDLFLGDASMPELDGIQAAIEICEMFPGCRVLLFSGERSSKILVREAGLKGHRFEIPGEADSTTGSPQANPASPGGLTISGASSLNFNIKHSAPGRNGSRRHQVLGPTVRRLAGIEPSNIHLVQAPERALL